MSEADTKLALALLEKKSCGYPSDGSLAFRCSCSESDCPCHSLSFVEAHGKVPLLDPELVRKPCTWGTGEESYDHGSCANNLYRNKKYICNGSGWLPSDSEMDWVRALNKAGYKVTYFPDGKVTVYDPMDIKGFGAHDTIFEATAQALGVPQETPDGSV